MSGVLILVRHGESEFNARNLFTGLRDVALTARGVDEAARIGARLVEGGFRPGRIYTSILRRTVESGRLINRAGGGGAEIVSSSALNERDYGELTGLDKDQAQLRWGAEQIRRWRRSYREAPPGGESLRDTVSRVLPYFLHEILPNVLEGSTVVVVGHGNGLRALTYGLEDLTEQQIAAIEFQTGEAVLYRVGDNARVREKVLISAERP